jgi:glycosyltransferase involved in cell wall biosynthesis
MPVIRQVGKMKVMHVGYSFNPSESGRGGVILYQWALMKAIRQLGFDVTFLVSSRHTFSPEMKVKIHNECDMKIIEIVNSPIKPYDYRSDPCSQLRNLQLESAVNQIFDAEKPEMIHIHDPRLLSASIVDVIKSRKIPVMKTVHNYFDLCSQGELMYGGKVPCSDFENGELCRRCVMSLPRPNYFNQKLSGTLRNHSILPYMKKLWRLYKKISEKNGGEAEMPYPSSAFKERRRFHIKRLNMLDVIHCSSHGSARIMKDYGIDEDRITILPITSGSTEMIRPKPLRSGNHPVVFGYLTGGAYVKGYETLIDAFARLDQRKAQLLVYGFDGRVHIKKKWKDLNIDFQRPYDMIRINDVMAKIDVGIVPSIWEEVFGLVGIEFISARIPVIASNIGGIREWLKDGINGYLVKAGDSDDLCSKMDMFVKDTKLISNLQKNMHPWISMDDHAEQMRKLYQAITEGKSCFAKS